VNIPNWFKQQPRGQRLIEVEDNWIKQYLPSLFGYQLLQLGGIAERQFLQHSRMRHRWLVEHLALPSPYACVSAQASHLPFATDSIDMLILPHTLDFCRDPNDILNECERLLIPEGHILITGFELWSLWGLRYHLPNPPPIMAQCRQLHHVYDICHNLKQMGYAIKSQQNYWFNPIHRQGLKINTPYLCGIYCVLAKKQQSVLTPIRPRWEARSKLVDQAVARFISK